MGGSGPELLSNLLQSALRPRNLGVLALQYGMVLTYKLWTHKLSMHKQNENKFIVGPSGGTHKCMSGAEVTARDLGGC